MYRPDEKSDLIFCFQTFKLALGDYMLPICRLIIKLEVSKAGGNIC